MGNIAIIPARGGSKRIPRKNIKEFLGKPIIAYSIEAAIKTKIFDEVMVSTDDLEISEISKKYGATIPFIRSAKNSSDYATTADVLLEVLEQYKNKGREFEYLCCIYPTAPFIAIEKLIKSYEIMIEKNVDGIIPVVPFGYPIQRAFRISFDNKLEYMWPENINKRSQDLEQCYHDAGQFYWSKIRSFIKHKYLLTDNTMPYILTEFEAHDIDNIDDWEYAEMKLLKKDKFDK